MEDTGSQIFFAFGEFRIYPSRGRLVNGKDDIVPLTPKVFDLLLYLVENPGKPLGKDEIMSAVWPDTTVEESNLSQNISILRRELGETRGERQFIVTIPGHGYKFIADVREVGESISAGGAEEEVDGEPIAPIPGISRWWLGLIAGATIVVIALAGYYFWRGPSDRTRATTIAVLPFKPLVAESRDEALEMGMADTLIARLSGNPQIVVRPLGSVRRYGNLEQDLQEAGRALGVESVLDGSVQRWGEKIRVNVRLVNVEDGASLWNGTFDERFTDIFNVQDVIANKVAEALRLRLSGDQAGRHSTESVEAYRLYLQGRYYTSRTTPAETRKGITFYQEAIEIDPLYALAYAGMADAYRTLPITSDVPAKEAFPKAKAAALKALEIDERLPEAHLVLGYVAAWYEWDWKTAENEITSALEISPNNSEAHRAFSLLLTVLGKHDPAVKEMRTARELDPLSLPTNALEAQALHYAGRDEEARDRINKTFEIEPNFWIARLMLARILIDENRFDEALAELNRAREASGGNSETISLTAFCLAKTGRRQEALTLLGQLKSRPYAPAYNIAMAYNGLGETGEALSWLETAAEDRDVRLILLKVDAKWNNLSQDPRFVALTRRMNLVNWL